MPSKREAVFQVCETEMGIGRLEYKQGRNVKDFQVKPFVGYAWLGCLVGRPGSGHAFPGYPNCPDQMHKDDKLFQQMLLADQALVAWGRRIASWIAEKVITDIAIPEALWRARNVVSWEMERRTTVEILGLQWFDTSMDFTKRVWRWSVGVTNPCGAGFEVDEAGEIASQAQHSLDEEVEGWHVLRIESVFATGGEPLRVNFGKRMTKTVMIEGEVEP